MATAPHPSNIHPTAVVSPRARIGRDCYVGPYSIVGDEVELADGVRLESHCVIDGHTSVGEGTHVFPFVSIGLAPQDLKYKGEASETRVGRRNRIREFATIHRGTAGGRMLTQTGDDCLIMAQAHIAHDCLLGNDVILANAARGHRRSGKHRRLLGRPPVLQSGTRSLRRRLLGCCQRRFALCLNRRQSRALLRLERHRHEATRLFAGINRFSPPCLSSPAVCQAEHYSGPRENPRRDHWL